MTPSRALIDEATSTFVQSGVSIIAASSGRQNVPCILRAVGCRVAPDRTRVTLLVPPYEPFLDAVQATGTVAVAFTRPSTHEALQLKGRDARLARRAKSDRSLMTAYADAFVAGLCPLGYTEELVRAMVGCDPEAVVAIAFRPCAAFQQTPGPRAGTPLNA